MPLSIVQAANESIARQLERLGMGSSEFQISESTLERMEKMLEDLMLLSTMENPAPRAINDTISVVSLVESVVNEFRPKFEQKGVAISLLINGHGSIRGDQTALHRMFVNVIENALRYTDASGAVQIHVIKEGHCLRISVSDTGIGIPDECLPHIFDRFYRVDASRSRSSGGSGLGLPIALAIAQVHHGKIDAQSKADTGSTFCITLPVDENH
jgi:signal transduction histidine kinase